MLVVMIPNNNKFNGININRRYYNLLARQVGSNIPLDICDAIFRSKLYAFAFFLLPKVWS